MRLEARRDWDIFTILGLTALLILSVYLIPDSVARTVLGLPFLLFFPGYLSVTALFPEKEELDSIERVALSFGLSIAITPLIGFLLNYTSWGIRLTPILLSISIFIVVAALLSLYRRQMAEEPFLPFDPVESISEIWRKFQAEEGMDKALSVILALSILSSVVALGYVVAFPRDGESFTEFYVLGEDGKASGYPQLSVGEFGTVKLGLVNHEHQEMDYTIVVWLVKVRYQDEEVKVDELYYYDTLSVSGLEHRPVDIDKPWEPQWEQDYKFNIFTVQQPLDGNYKVWFSLFKGDESFNYADDGANLISDEKAVSYIKEAVRNERQSLSLNMHLEPTHFYLKDEDSIPSSLSGSDELDLEIGIINYEGVVRSYKALAMIGSGKEVKDEETGETSLEFTKLRWLGDIEPTEWENVVISEVDNGDFTWSDGELFSVNLDPLASTYRGDLKIWFLLFKDDPLPSLTALTDYHETENVVKLFEEAYRGERQFLSLDIKLS